MMSTSLINGLCYQSFSIKSQIAVDLKVMDQFNCGCEKFAAENGFPSVAWPC